MTTVKPAKTTVTDPNVKQAAYSTAKSVDPDTTNKANAYLIPSPAKQPKHLFHMIMRFEGSGMDSAVADLTKKFTPDSAAGSEAGKSEPSRLEPANQLFHFIIRYEGDGLIDGKRGRFHEVVPEAEFLEGEGIAGFQKGCAPSPRQSLDCSRTPDAFCRRRVDGAARFSTGPTINRTGVKAYQSPCDSSLLVDSLFPADSRTGSHQPGEVG